jgi:Ca2+-binding RTX toxin-like protein
MANIQGTSGDDTLFDTEEEDTISGLDGNDTINATLRGFDTLLGGNGNDRIFVSRYNDNSIGSLTVDGGAGQDFIRITSLRDYGAIVSGGADNDRIEIETTRSTTGISIDAGSGDDVILLTEFGQNAIAISLATGTGADVIRFVSPGATATKLNVTLTDFTVGAGGDRIDFGDYLNLLLGWTQDSNPFAGGFMFLAQNGADTILYVDRDGLAGPSGTLNALLTFKNITAGSLTAYNFFGYAPDGSPPVALVLNGTAGDDVLTGEAGNDVIHGLGGNDMIDGKNGSDTIYGDEGNDTLVDYDGAAANLYGGIGNDTLIVSRYAPSYISSPSIIDGGDDDDFIDVRFGNPSMTILGGAGNDIVRVVIAGPGPAAIDLGSGADVFLVATSNVTVTLGAGADIVRYESYGNVTVTDFQAGAGGDSVDLTSALLFLSYRWDYATNPFATGHAVVTQNGANVIVRLDQDGTGGGNQFYTATLQNVTLAQLTADNFGGWNPNGSQPVGQVLTGTPGPDVLTGGIAGDTISGLGGDDVLKGFVGNDMIDGGAGNDILDGEYGSDTVDGGLDNDLITDAIDGNDTLRGGAGDDIIVLTRTAQYFTHGPSTVTLEGGADNDTIRVVARGAEDGELIHATINGGTGNDLVQITGLKSGTIDLGDGNDRIELTSYFQLINAAITMGAGQDVLVLTRPSIAPGEVSISDFQVGDNGDRLEFVGFGGPLNFVQQGANTLVVETVGNSSRTMLYLLNVQASQLSNYNTGQPTTGTSGPDQISGNNSISIIYGLDGDDRLYGNGGDDQLYGGEGNDFIDGGSGNDRMEGGSGNDLYYVSEAGDVIVEAVGGGNDGVYSYVSYVLTAGAEVETLSTISHAATTAINLTGNSFNQNVVGNAGANILHGGGGVDGLYGFGGNDIYYTDVAATQVFENVGGGTDAVYTSVSYVLNGSSEVETLSVNDYAATSAINLTGNVYNQTIVGNAGANILHGGGGTDQLYGQGGNDVYYTDVASTQVFENAGGGTDAVYTSVSYVLGGSSEVETLSANDWGAATALSLTGNSFAQLIVGNAGNNVFNGGGGADTLYGFGGNDVYYVDLASVQVVEAAGGGNDAIYTSVSYTLAGGAEVELLSTNSYAATGAINLTGNGFSNVVAGNAGANTLNGGAGADTLHGFGGADNFAFTTALGGGNVDLLADFVAADDTIQLDDAIFAGIGTPGAFNANAFVVGSAAADADDRIVYNQATGQLFYDADGNGAGAAVLFATLSGAPLLTASDFAVI